MKTTIEYNDSELEIEHRYIEYREADYLQPSEGGYDEIIKIFHEGIDVTELFTNPYQLVVIPNLHDYEDSYYWNEHKVDELWFLTYIKEPYNELETLINNI